MTCPSFLVLFHFPSCGPWAPSQPRSCHDRIPRSRSSGPGAAKVEVAPSVLNLTWTDAVSKYVWEMQYTVCSTLCLEIYIYIHIHTYNDIVNMLLYCVNIWWYLWSIRCWGRYVLLYRLLWFADFSKTDLSGLICCASNLDTTRWISACIGQSQAFRGQDAHLGWQSV